MESVELVLSEEDSLWWEWFVKLVGIEQGVKYRRNVTYE